LCEPDYIHAGFVKSMGLEISKKYERESLGVCRYELSEVTTAAALADRARERLGIDFPRVAGDGNAPVKTVCLGLGSVGMDQITVLERKDCDLFITGEVGEVKVLEYVRDMCFFGNKKAVLVLGHFGSEYAGMRLLADTLREKGIDAEYLHGGEVY
jgi:putative NIF3 family GTP cyclohydrolase 1 type 2